MYSHILLKGQPVAEKLFEHIQSRVQKFKTEFNRPPTLATVLIGEDPASHIYVRKKGETCIRLGLGYKDFKLSAKISQQELIDLIAKLNNDPTVDGILVQRPLPKPLIEGVVFDLLEPSKDVDCFSPFNVGLLVQNRCPLLPCTPAGIMDILSHYRLSVSGKNALVIGRSDIVGKPMGLLLLHANATVTTAHSKTKNLADEISRADLVVSALGKPHFLTESLPWKKDCVVIDVGINRQSNGSLVGDVDFENVKQKVSAITPVPGGVGPLTIARLMENTLIAAEKRMGQHD